MHGYNGCKLGNILVLVFIVNGDLMLLNKLNLHVDVE